MQLGLEFLTGDADAIVAAIKELDFGRLQDPDVVAGRADLSLEIETGDLDLLSLKMAEFNQLAAIELGPQLQVVLDEPEYGLLEINREWIEYAAAIPDEKAADLAKSWCAAMSSEQGRQREPDESLTAGVTDLLALCKIALRENKRVFHFWYSDS